MDNRTDRSKILLDGPRSQDLEDGRLVKACLSGDGNAWNLLVDRYQRLVYAVPRRAGLSTEQSEDIFQDVFVTLLEKINSVEQPERIRAWLVTTAKYKTWSAIRSSKGEHSPATEEEMENEMASLRDESPLADDNLIALEQQHIIRSAVAMLDERCKKIVSMIYLADEGASYIEVANSIGVGASSVSPLRTRCLKKLEKLLSK